MSLCNAPYIFLKPNKQVNDMRKMLKGSENANLLRANMKTISKNSNGQR